MKLYIILLYLLIETTVSLHADNNRDRDSILASINAIENDSARLAYELIQQSKYIRSPFASVLVDKLYEDARKVGDKEKEMIALCGYFNIANSSLDVPEIETQLKRIEEHAYKYNLYDYFFRCKRSYLSLMASNGNIEWAINEANKMLKEATRINHQVGIVSSRVALAQAYKFSRNNLKVIETLQEILKSDPVEDKEKISIYQDLYTSFYNIGSYNEALKYLDLQHSLLKDMASKDANSEASLRVRIMHTESLYADIYMILGNYNKAEEHIKLSEKYYNPTCFLTYFVFYHNTHAAFYAHSKKWDLCLSEMDKAIGRLEKEQPMLKLAIMSNKGRYLEQAGRLSEAVATHRKLLAASDSLNQNFIQKQEEALAQNYRWECGQVQHAKNAYIISLISIIFIALLLIVISTFLAKLYWTYIQLQRAKKEAEKAEKLAIEADRLKEALLKNISNEIETPLNKISKILGTTASANSVVPNKEFIQDIYKETTSLIKLLDLVVVFSKLEVGAIPFNIRQVDIIGICHKAMKDVKEKLGNKAEITFTTQVEFQPMRIDFEWMLLCLTTALMVPDGYELSYKLDFTVTYSDDGKMVEMKMIGSPLSDLSFNTQIQAMQNHINNLFIKSFDGIYDVQASKLRPILIISLPHNGE